MMLESKRFWRIFLEILACQLILVILMGVRKPSFFVDEIWTYNLANAYYFPAFDNVEGYFYTWIQPDFWKTLVTVSSEHRFAYDSVWHSQSVDVLPPFFYAIVHTVSSFFPEKFSVWFVLGPNVAFFAGTQILLILIARKIFQQSWQALVPVTAYGFTLGSLNTVLYLRMYMMVTFFGILAFYLHLNFVSRLRENINSLTRKDYLAVLAIFVCGFLTHYYFLIFATFLAFPFIWYLNHQGAYKACLQYLGTCLSALVVSCAIFPYCVMQITGFGAKSGYRGTQSMDNAFNSAFLRRLSEYNPLLIKDLGGDMLLLLLLIVGIWTLNRIRQQFLKIALVESAEGKSLTFVFGKPHNCYSLSLTLADIYVALAMVVSICYYCVIVKISVMSDDRYIYMILPLVVTWGFYWLNRLVTYLSGKRYLATTLCILMVWVAAMYSFRFYNLKFADMELSGTLETVEEKYEDVPMVVINQLPHWHPIIEHISLLEKFSQTYLTTENETNKVKPALEEIKFSGDTLLFFVTWECKRPLKELQEEMKRATGLHNIKCIYEGGKYKRGHLYVLTK